MPDHPFITVMTRKTTEIACKLQLKEIAKAEAERELLDAMHIELDRYCPGGLFSVKPRIYNFAGEWWVRPELSGVSQSALDFIEKDLGLENVFENETGTYDWAHDPERRAS